MCETVIRFKYERGRKLKYLAHLDMMTLFERALKRAEIDVAFSQGYNKRPRLVFGMPISLGMISLAEYADITINRHVSCQEFIQRLNRQLPEGAKIIEAAYIDGKRNIMSAVAYARYRIVLRSPMELEEAMTKLMSMNEVLVKKEKKGQVTMKDIRSGIISAGVFDDDICLFMTSGSNRNIKPEEFLVALEKFLDQKISVKELIREELYLSDEGGRPVNPFDERVV
jgi:radical SAM-linked protein